MRAALRARGRRLLALALLLLPRASAPLGSSWEWDVIAPGGAAPSARAGASLTRLGAADSSARLVLCGGQGADRRELSGCALLDPHAAWSFAPVLAEARTAWRSDHAAAVVPAAAGGGGASFLLLYGGVNATPVEPSRLLGASPLLSASAAAPAAPPASASALAFASAGCEIIDVSTWLPAPAANDCDVAHAPAARYAHSAALLGSAWLVFGGLSSAGNSLLDDGVQPLDTAGAPALKWAAPFKPSTGDRPQARAYHAAAAWGSTMVVYGGQGDAQGSQLLSDVWLLAPVVSVGDVAKASWSQRADAGGAGAARPLRGHRLELAGALLLVYGGQGGPAGGLLTLDLATPGAAWAAPSVAGTGLNAPFRAAVALRDADGEADPELVVFGGASISGNGAVSGGLAVMRPLGADNSITSSQNLPYILGGGGVALLLLGGLALVGLSRSRSRARGGAGGGGGGGESMALFERGMAVGAAGAGGAGRIDYELAYQATGSPVTGYREGRRVRQQKRLVDPGEADDPSREEDDEQTLRF